MKLRLLPSLFLLRKGVQALQGIREQLTLQNQYLARLADQFAPLPPVVDRELVRAETGVDYVDPIDQAVAQAYVDRTIRDTGHAPTDDEILSYLSDEKTIDLHSRLLARDREAERLAEERRR